MNYSNNDTGGDANYKNIDNDNNYKKDCIDNRNKDN